MPHGVRHEFGDDEADTLEARGGSLAREGTEGGTGVRGSLGIGSEPEPHPERARPARACSLGQHLVLGFPAMAESNPGSRVAFRPAMRRFISPLALPVLAAALLAGCGSADPGPPTGGAVPKPQKPFAVDVGSGFVACLRAAKIPVNRTAPQVIQVGDPAQKMHVFVAQTPGAADVDQLQGRAEGAEVVGSLEFFTGNGTESAIDAIEGCVNAHGSDG